MKTISYTFTLRGQAFGGTDNVSNEINADDNPLEVGHALAKFYGANLEAIFLSEPIESLRVQLRECSGFVEAWKAHLLEVGALNAAETVHSVLVRMRHAYMFAHPNNDGDLRTIQQTNVLADDDSKVIG